MGNIYHMNNQSILTSGLQTTYHWIKIYFQFLFSLYLGYYYYIFSSNSWSMCMTIGSSHILYRAYENIDRQPLPLNRLPNNLWFHLYSKLNNFTSIHYLKWQNSTFKPKSKNGVVWFMLEHWPLTASRDA